MDVYVIIGALFVFVKEIGGIFAREAQESPDEQKTAPKSPVGAFVSAWGFPRYLFAVKTMRENRPAGVVARRKNPKSFIDERRILFPC